MPSSTRVNCSIPSAPVVALIFPLTTVALPLDEAESFGAEEDSAPGRESLHVFPAQNCTRIAFGPHGRTSIVAVVEHANNMRRHIFSPICGCICGDTAWPAQGTCRYPLGGPFPTCSGVAGLAVYSACTTTAYY